MMRRFTKIVLLVGFLLGAFVALKGFVLAIPSGTWQATANLSAARPGASASLLQNGSVLITGGDPGSGPVASADLFNSDGSVSPLAAPMNNPRSNHISATLQDGRVVVAGGTVSGGGATNSAEIFDPVSGTWSSIAGGMVEARSGAAAALLQDGRVLIAGGESSGVASATLEIFDPVAATFSAAGVMSSPRTKHAMAVLADGRVIIIGGSNGTAPVASTDILNPVAGSVAAGPSLATRRSGHSATTLLDGRVLVVGGNNIVTNPDGSTTTVDLASAETFDPTAGTFTTSASALATARAGHLAFLLPHNNNVLIVGGTSSGVSISSAELFTPWQGTFSAAGSLSTARSNAAGSTMLQDGLLLVAGGKDAATPPNALSSTEVYGFATVKTDRADYAPGEIVTITGSGWQPGETVTLSFLESPLIDTHPNLTAVADASGNIVNAQFSPDIHDLDIRFYLTAVGSVSGIQAQNTFTDSNPSSLTVTPSSITVAPGVAADYTISIVYGGNNNPCTVTFTVSGLPTGAASVPNPPTPVTGMGGETKTSALHITTTASGGSATPPGPYTITVTGTRGGGGCNGSGNLTGATTLIVQEPTTTTLTSSVNPTVFGQSTTLTATVAQTAGTTVPTGTVTFKDGATTLGTVSLVGGTATLAVSSLTAAGSPHTLTASYAGVANTFGASNSNTVTQTVNQASTTTTIARTTGPSPSVFGQSLTFTATVSAVAPGAGTPTGTVAFKDGVTTLATVSLAGSTAAFTTTTLAVGGHSITATYNADTNFTTSTAGSVSQTVNQAATTTAITAHTPNPSVVGQSVTVNFSVTPVLPGSGTPTGNVTVSDGLGDTCTATAAAGTCSITFPAVGTKTLSAVYAGDTNFTGSTSANAPHTVNAAATTTTITNSVALGTASIVNQSYAVNYSVAITSPGGGTIPGTDTVTVTDGTDSCTGTVAAATCSLTSTTTGSKTITAKYNGDPNYSSSTSAGVPHTVGIAPTITSANNTAFTVNSAGTFTVTATGSPAPTFSETGALPSGVTLSSAGVLSGTPALGTVGSYPITITATNGVGSDATQNFTLTVNKLTPTFASLTASQTIPFGQASISLSGRVNGFVMMPGTVTIHIDGVNSPALSLSGNPNNFSNANFDTHTLSVSGSPYTITYTYSGDANSNSASDTSTQLTVTKVTPTVNWATPTPITYNTALSATQLNAAFTASFNSGTVTVAGTPTYNPASGTVLNAGVGQTLSVSFVPTDTIDYNNANGTALITVNKASTSTAVTSSLNPSFSGQSVTFTATVSNSSGTSAVPTGSVQFMDGASPLGSPQPLSAGHATLTTTALSVATHSITAVYTNSDGNFTGSTSPALSQVVKNAATTTAVSSSLNPSTYGNSVTFTATVAAVDPSAGTPTGTVTFTIDGTPGAPVPLSPCAPPVAAAACASVSTSTLTVVGSPHTVAANYAHTGSFLDSSGALAGGQTVNKATPTVTVTDPQPTYDGNPHSATAAAVGVDGHTAVSGGFSFTYDGSATAPTNAETSYAVVATFTSSDTNYTGATGNGALTIKQADSTTTVTGGTFTYDGNAHAASVSVTGVGGLSLTPPPTYGGACSAAPVHVADTPCTASYTFAGDANHKSSSGTAIITITKAPSATTVSGGGSFVFDGNPHAATVSVTGAGSLNLTPAPNYSCGSAPIHVADTPCTASYTFTGDGDHDGSSGSAVITITKAPSSTVVSGGGSFVFDGNAHAATVSVTGVGGLGLTPVPTYSCGSAPIHVADTPCTASYTFAGDADHFGSNDSTTITITKAPSTTTVSGGGSFVFDGNAHAATVSVTGAGGLTLTPVPTYSCGSAPIHVADTPCTASYTFAGDSDHFGSNDSTTITITKAPSVTTVLGGGSFVFDGFAHAASVSVTGVGGLSLTPAPTYGGACTAAPVHVADTPCTASYTFAGDSDHFGSNNSTTITITKAPSVTTVSGGGSFVFDGFAHAASVSVTGVGGLSLTPAPTYGGACTAAPVHVAETPCTASYTFAGDGDHFGSNNSVTITITKAPTTTTISAGYTVTYDGLQHGVSASVTGAGGLNLSVPVTYTPPGNTSTPFNPGVYTASATFSGDPDHLGSTSASVTITIVYGICSAGVGPGDVILPPINNDGTSVYQRKGGSTIPVKFRVCDAFGNSISNPAAVFAPVGGSLSMLSAVRGTIDNVNETGITDVPDVAFRYSGGQWIFNMATSNLTAGNTYQFRINLAYGPASITFQVGVK
ncbi:MAG: Ig-like domain repeat protein [Candidatus Acidiferrum sp.]